MYSNEEPIYICKYCKIAFTGLYFHHVKKDYKTHTNNLIKFYDEIIKNQYDKKDYKN